MCVNAVPCLRVHSWLPRPSQPGTTSTTHTLSTSVSRYDVSHLTTVGKGPRQIDTHVATTNSGVFGDVWSLPPVCSCNSKRPDTASFHYQNRHVDNNA